MHFSTANDREDHSARWTEKLNGWQQEGVGRYKRIKSRYFPIPNLHISYCFYVQEPQENPKGGSTFVFVFFIDGEKPGLCMQIQSIVKAGHY